MPLTAKGNEILSHLEKEYGEEKGKQVLYAGKNKGTFTGIDAALDRVVDAILADADWRKEPTEAEKRMLAGRPPSKTPAIKIDPEKLKQAQAQREATNRLMGRDDAGRHDDHFDPTTLPNVHAAGVIFKCGENALFLQRSAAGDHPGEWCYPGGKIEGDESPEQAAKRECREEIGTMPKGELELHTRRISPGISAPSIAVSETAATAEPAVLPFPVPGVDFTTFVVKVKEEFEPTLDNEHTGYAWAPISNPPQPMHPDAALALAKFTMNELDIAEAIQRGDLTSPQQYMNIWLVQMRITGTGMAYRHKHKEYVWRSPEIFLNERFVKRCNGLPVIIEHPPGETLDTEEYRERNIGSILLPYIFESEVWGIAKIYDAAAAELLIEKKLSTSPAVVFRPSDGNTEGEIDGSKILVEGDPSLLDHLAVCRSGVWDKGDEPNGISIKGDSNVPEEKKEEKKADAGDLKSMLDSFRSDMKECMGKMDAHGARMDSHTKRMDEYEEKEKEKAADKHKRHDDDDDAKKRHDAEEEKKKADAKKADDDDRGKRHDDDDAKKKADAEEEERKADAKRKDDDDAKKRHDAEEEEKKKADASRADSATVSQLLKEVAELRSKIPAVITDDQRAAFADVQARHDTAYMAFSQRAPAPLVNEGLGAYRRRLATELKKHSPTWKDADLVAMKDDATFGQIEQMVIADAMKSARNPVDLPYGRLQRMVRKDDTGTREIIEYGGDPRSWMDQFGGIKRQVKNINRDHRLH